MLPPLQPSDNFLPPTPPPGTAFLNLVPALVPTDDLNASENRGGLCDIAEHQHAEQALLEAQAFYHSLVDQLPAGVFRKDPAGRFVFVSPWFCRQKNLPAENFLGKTILEMTANTAAQKDPTGRSGKYALWGDDHHRQIMESGKTIELVEEYTTAEGQPQFIHVIKFPMVNPEGKIIGTQGILFDITARLKTESALHDEQRILSTLMQSMPDSIYFKDTASRFIRTNPAMIKRLGLPSSADAIGKTDADFFSPEHAVQARADELEIMRTSQPLINFEEKETWPDGSVTWAETTKLPLRDHAGQIVGTYGISRNITARKQAEQAIAALALRNETLLQTASDGIHVLNDQGQVVEANAAFCRMLGYTRDEGLRLNVADWDVQWSRKELLVRISELIIQPALFETKHRRKDGTVFEAEINCVGVTLEGKNYLYASSRDITARKRAEKEKAQLELQLRQSQKQEAIGQLAGGIAHDFKNLITAILGNADLLQEDTPLTPAMQLDLLQQISQAGKRASALTEQLLLFSRREEPVQQNLELNQVVAEMVKLLQRIISEHIDLQLHYAPQPQPIQADSGMLDQILLNLVVNAHDAMPTGGKLIIRTAELTLKENAPKTALTEWHGTAFQPGQDRPLLPSPTPSADATTPPESRARAGEFTCLSVTDEGCGMTPEVMVHMFEPFFTTKEVGRGTGLGLATVYSIVQQHRGWIEVASQPGQGTTFRIYLPRLLDPHTPEPVISLTPPDLAGHGETILVVEDEASVRTILRIMLERAGYRVLESASGAAALELWPKHREEIELLITDMVMPGAFGGVQLAQKLRKEKPELKIIIMSGYSDNLDQDRKKFDVEIAFIPKPFMKGKVLATVRTQLDAPPAAKK